MISITNSTLYDTGDITIGFMVFRGRSGSTLIGDRFSRHPDILVTPESEMARRLAAYFKRQDGLKNINYSDLAEYLKQEQKLRDWKFSWKDLEERFYSSQVKSWADALYVICQLYKDTNKKTAKLVIIKKNSWNYKNINTLLSINPKIKSIWIVRDPRAVYSSARKAIHSQTKKPLARNIIHSALDWLDYMQRLSEAERKWKDRIIKIRYEDFLKNMPGELNKAWQKVGVHSLNEKTLETELTKIETSHLVMNSTAHLHTNLSKAPQLSRIEGWKKELPFWRSMLIDLICKRKMKEFGYY